ncbi:MAG: cytochrome c biogenesis protein ResB [Paludibacter sp.]|nr:cytochrome c biogenesis protein ResB [Paludibacter sp.]
MQKENPGTGAEQKNWWQTPWGYKESLVVVVGFLLVGWLLQITVGEFDYDIIRFPVNIMLLAAIFVVVFLLSLKSKTPFFAWLSGVPLSISVIGAMLLLGIIMGLVMQAPPSVQSNTFFGFDIVTRSWAFVLVYFLTLVNLSCVVVRRLLNFTWKDYAFYLNHIGLLLLLMAGGMGAADLRRYVMYVEEGNTEWRVYSDEKDVLELPIAIKLNDFYMEEYMPKLAIIDKTTGDAIPKEKPQLLQIDTLQPNFKIAGWHIEIKEYLHDAIRNSDSTYRHVPMPGACPAVLVTVTNTNENLSKTGWVCSGNFAQLYMTMELNEQLSLVMTRPEAKLFRSDIVVYTESEKAISHQLEVNKPLSIENWMIYQYGYDVDRGSASTWSSFELVYDPWLMWVYVGLWMFIAGSVLLMWEGKKKQKYELES